MSHSWWEAVNSEFVYEQGQIQSMNLFQHCYESQLDDVQCVSSGLGDYQSAHNFMTETRPLSTCYSTVQSEYPCTFPDIPTYPPCQGPRPWNFAYCYGYYGEPACPLINMVDMEDFM